MEPPSTTSRLEWCDNDGSATPGLEAILLYSCDTLEVVDAFVRPEFPRSVDTSWISSGKIQPCSCGTTVPPWCSLLIMASWSSLRTDPTGRAGGLPTRERQAWLRLRPAQPSGDHQGLCRRLLPAGGRGSRPVQPLHRPYLPRRIPRSASERRGRRFRRPPFDSWAVAQALLIGRVERTRVQLERTPRNSLGSHAKSVDEPKSEAAKPCGVAWAALVVLLAWIELLMFGGDQEKENVLDSFLKSVGSPI